MKVKIDKDKCIGCALCTTEAEEVFEMKTINDEFKAEVKTGVDLEDKKITQKVKNGVEMCPVEAIEVT